MKYIMKMNWCNTIDIAKIVISYLNPSQLCTFFLNQSLDFRIKFKFDGSKYLGNTRDNIMIFNQFPNMDVIGIRIINMPHNIVFDLAERMNVAKIEKIVFGLSWKRNNEDEYDIMLLRKYKRLSSLCLINLTLINLSDLERHLGLQVVNLSCAHCSKWSIVLPWVRHLRLPTVDLIDVSIFSKYEQLRTLYIMNSGMVGDTLSVRRLKRLVLGICGVFCVRDVRCKRLRSVVVRDESGWGQINRIPRFNGCSSLTSAEINNCHFINNVDGLNCLKLRKFVLKGYFGGNLDGLSACPNLAHIVVSKCEITNWDWLELCHGLRKLVIFGCANLEKLGEHPQLEEIEVERCGKLKDVTKLQNCLGLWRVCIEKCSWILNIDCLAKCEALRFLKIEGCRRLRRIDWKGFRSRLEELSIMNCRTLGQVDGFMNCANLRTIGISGCEELKIQPKSKIT